MNRICTWLCALACCALAACGGGSDEAPPSGPPVVTIDTSRAATATIGAAGGTLAATGADGTAYTLTVPPDALVGEIAITMTPVRRIDRLPLSGGMVGAVQLQPSGLQLARMAVLTIGQPAPARAALTLTGFGIDEAATRVERSAAAGSEAAPRVLVGHFSTHGAGYGSAQDLASLEIPPGRTDAEGEAFIEAMDTLLSAYGRAPTAIQSAYLDWFDGAVLPMAQRAATDVELLDALREYADWNGFALYVSDDEASLDAFSAAVGEVDALVEERIAAWQSLVAPKFRTAIRANNDRCRAEPSLAALSNVLFLQRSATVPPWIRPAVQEAHGIDLNTVLRELCARLVVDQRSLAERLESTAPSDLDITYGLLFEGQTESQGVPVQVSFSGGNARFGRESPANSDIAGAFTVAVSALDADQAVTIDLKGCLVLEDALVGHWVTGVCVDEQLLRNGGLPRVEGWYEGTSNNRGYAAPATLHVRQSADGRMLVIFGTGVCCADKVFELGPDGTLGFLGESTSNVDFTWAPSPAAYHYSGHITGTVMRLEYYLSGDLVVGWDMTRPY